MNRRRDKYHSVTLSTYLFYGFPLHFGTKKFAAMVLKSAHGIGGESLSDRKIDWLNLQSSRFHNPRATRHNTPYFAGRITGMYTVIYVEYASDLNFG
jgi:hypothetical protein